MRRFEPQQPSAPGLMVDYAAPRDDAMYEQAAVLPGWLRRSMATDRALHDRVMESITTQSYRSPFGAPYRTADDVPMAPATEDPLKEWDWATRERILTNCHAVYQRNPLANSIVQFTADFTIGDGFNLTCKNKDVERVLLDFIENTDNAIREYERQAVIDLQVDGELLLRFFEQGGETVMVPQRPWELEWIQTELGFFRRPQVYRFQRYLTEGDSAAGETKTDYEDVPARAIHHVAINRHSYELRGRPELYRLLPWLRADKEFLEDRSMQNKWRGALLWHVRVAGATPAIIASVLNRWRKPPSPGSAYVSTDKEEVTPLTNSTNAGDASTDGRAIRLMNILGARLPEYFFADGENANLASATKQELPALTKFETFQRVMIERLWSPVFKRVIENAVNAGVLPETVEVQAADGDAIPDEEPVSAVDAFEVTYEPVTSTDLNTLAQAYNLMSMNGWVSDKTAQEKLGLDPYIEEKRIKMQREIEADEMAQGLRPIPPGMTPDGMPDPNAPDDEEDSDAVQRAPNQPTAA